jgi:6-phosphofructokinase 1
VVAEGAVPVAGTMALQEPGVDEFGHVRLGGIGNQLAPEIEERTGIETRATTLGHIQRGGTPTAYDRVLATRYGMAAVESINSGHWGRMVALRGTQIVHVPFEDALGRLKVVPQNRYDEAAVLFG